MILSLFYLHVLDPDNISFSLCDARSEGIIWKKLGVVGFLDPTRTKYRDANSRAKPGVWEW